MKKSFLVTTIAIALICALAGFGTMAWFTGSATSEVNTFNAGTLRLGGASGEGFVEEQFMTLSVGNMQPDEHRVLGTTRLKNMGSLPLKIYRMSATNPEYSEDLRNALEIIVKMDEQQVFRGRLADLFYNPGGYFDLEHRLLPDNGGEEVEMQIEVILDPLASDSLQGANFECDLILHAVQTNKTTVLVMDSVGNPVEGARVDYRVNSWKQLGYTNANGEIATIFPDNFSTTDVRVSYSGYSKTYTQNIMEKSTFIFGTASYTVELRDSQGNPIPNAGAQVRYAGGSSSHWLGVTDANGRVTRELLPGDYWFEMVWRGKTSPRQTRDVDDQSTVTFYTGKVHSESNTARRYFVGNTSYHFINNMELIPGEYTFEFNDGTANYTIIERQVNNIR